MSDIKQGVRVADVVRTIDRETFERRMKATREQREDINMAERLRRLKVTVVGGGA